MTMTFEEFCASVTAEVTERHSGCTVRRQTVEKLTEKYEGLMVQKAGRAEGIAVSLDAFYQDYRDGESMDALLERMEEMLKETPEFTIDDYTDYAAVKDRLFIRVFDRTRIPDGVLEQCPYRDAGGNLVITYAVYMPVSSDSFSSLAVRSDLLKEYGITAEQLHCDAMKSSPGILPAVITDMRDLIPGIPASLSAASRHFMYCITNDREMYGASAVFYPGVLEDAAEKLGGDIFLIPSSQHEMLAVAADPDRIESTKLTIRMINATQVSSSDQLSDQLFHYDVNRRIFETAEEYAAHLHAC